MIKVCTCGKRITIQPRRNAMQLSFVCESCKSKYGTQVAVHVKVSGISKFLSSRRPPMSGIDNVVRKKVLGTRSYRRSS